MSERLTDKKRGFVTEPGNLISGVNGLSLNRFMREILGGLSQTQVKRFTPEGNVIIKGFGMYEKVISEPISKVEEIPGKERLVMVETYTSNPGPYQSQQIVKLIAVNTDNYKVITSLDVKPLLQGGYAISIGWNYEKNCFIVFAMNNYYPQIYEITTAGVSTLVAQYNWDPAWWTTYQETYQTNYEIEFFHSYGATGKESRMWFAIDDYDYGYTHILPINNSYRFGKYVDKPVDISEYMLISPQDCDAYFSEVYYHLPTLSWITHNNVRIIKPVEETSESDYGLAFERAFEVNGKIAYIHNEGWDNQPDTIRLCGRYGSFVIVNGKLVWDWIDDEDGNKNTSPAYLEKYSTIKTATIFASGSVTTYSPLAIFFDYGFYTGVCSIDHIVGPTEDNKLYCYLYWGTDIGGDIIIPYEFTYSSYYTNEFQVVKLDPTIPEGGQLYILDPGGVGHYITAPNAEGGEYIFDVALICWYVAHPYSWLSSEDYSDGRYVNKHYIVVGSTYPAFDYRVFVADGATEKYEIPLGDPGEIYEVRLERVITK
ncbi:MAG: hypothetical protein V1709_03000 [Planctomycetota bacterium]